MSARTTFDTLVPAADDTGEAKAAACAAAGAGSERRSREQQKRVKIVEKFSSGSTPAHDQVIYLLATNLR